MRFIVAFIVGFITLVPAYGYTNYSSTKDYFSVCDKVPFNKDSACYAFFLGILYTMMLYPQPCFKPTDSDKEIYEKVMRISKKYLQAHPDANIYTSATILAHSVVKAYPCKA